MAVINADNAIEAARMIEANPNSVTRIILNGQNVTPAEVMQLAAAQVATTGQTPAAGATFSSYTNADSNVVKADGTTVTPSSLSTLLANLSGNTSGKINVPVTPPATPPVTQTPVYNGLSAADLNSALTANQTALSNQNKQFLTDWGNQASTLKNDILTGVDTKNQQFGTQATQGFMDAFKNFQIPTNQQTGVNLGNYNDNRNAAADQWWSQYVTGRR